MMPSSARLRVVTAAVVVVFGAWTGGGFAQTAGPDAVKAEVRKALEDYVAAFSARRADLIAERSIQAPMVNLGGTGATASMTAEDVRRRYEGNLKALDAQKYQRSTVDSATVCLLNDASAIVSGEFTRYRTDGSVLSKIAATYVFAKTNGQWKITTLIGHGTDRAIACKP
jgi:hypothetical protein